MKKSEALRLFKEFDARAMRDLRAYNQEFGSLISQPHDDAGRLLKCHLILEHYLDEALIQIAPSLRFNRARVAFYQKFQLLSEHKLLRPHIAGIVGVNRIRNRFAHDLDFRLAESDFSGFELVRAFRVEGAKRGGRPAPRQNSIELIEAFTEFVGMVIHKEVTRLSMGESEIDLLEVLQALGIMPELPYDSTEQA